MKRLISLIVAVACIISSVSLCANAAGWLKNAKSVEFGTTYNLSVNAGKPDYYNIGSYGYYLAVKIYVPATGKITYYTENESDSSLPSGLEIYNSDNLNDPVLDYYCECNYNSAYGVYYSTKTFTLSKGTYYFLLDVFDASNEISSGECDGSFLLNVKYSYSIAKTSGIKCTSRNTSAQKIAWNKVSGANGYQVQRSNNGGTAWSSYYSTSGNSYVFSGLTAGGKYKFRVRAYKTVDGKDYFGKWSSTLCSCCTPAKPKLKSVSSPKHTQIKTTWAKASGTKSGYQILYGKNAKFSSIAARKNVSSSYSSYTGKNFTKGRTYYVKVRTYTSFNGKAYYSAWSATKKVKCK